jgi:hypothetical protein
MFPELLGPIGSAWRRLRRRLRPYDDFSDGSSLTEIHRYCIRYKASDGRFVDIGFEADVSRSYVWIIHESTLSVWTDPEGKLISSEEKKMILGRLIEYCDARKLRRVIEP